MSIRTLQKYLGIVLVLAFVSCKVKNSRPGLHRLPIPNQKLRGIKEIINDASALNLENRQDVFLSEFLKGNVPNRIRKFVPMTIKEVLPSGKKVALKLWISPDYLAIGSDQKYIYMPLTPQLAQKIAFAHHSFLPTQKLVDRIYSAAQIKLNPQPMPQCPNLSSVVCLLSHTNSIARQLLGIRNFAGQVIAGHKKDIVVTRRLRSEPMQVAIYGWHRSEGNPIQPLSLVHDRHYYDYSHGIRLVFRKVVLNGTPMDIEDVFRDPQLNTLVSYEKSGNLPRYY